MKKSFDKLRETKYYNVLTVVFRLILGATFIVAAIPKIQDLAAFRLIVENYNILPEFAITPFAYALPFIELILGLMIIVGLFTKPVTWALVFLLVVFIIAISINLWRGEEAVCGCFSVDQGGSELGWKTIIRDIILLVLAAHVLLSKRFILALDNLQKRAITEIGVSKEL